MFGFLLAWYNLPFVMALGGCVLFALLQLLGGFGDQDADADLDADLDVDAGLDVDANLDGDLSTAEHAALGSHSAGDQGGLFADALASIGVGRVPLALVMMMFLGSFGAIGLLLSTLLVNALGSYPAAAFLLILVGGLLLALLLTSRTSRLLARLVSDSSTAVGFEQLVGRVGVVTSHSLSSTYGRVQVRDSFGTLHTVYAVIDSGDPLPERSEVALLAYDPAQRRFVVRSMEKQPESARSRRRE